MSLREQLKLVRHIHGEINPYLKQLSRRRIERVIGTSGTILSLGALAAGRRPTDDIRNLKVSVKALSRMSRRLTAMTLQQRLKLPNLDPRRADLAPAGALLLDELLDGLGAEEITLCDFALREGLILDYIARNGSHIKTVERYPDVRRRSVVELGERCNYLPAHAQQVARLSLAVFDATRSLHKLGQREREWLEYGALLHDIGIHISYERHHKHAFYLIRNGGLRGFEPEEVDIIGLVARYHRQATPKASHEGFSALPKERRQAVRVLGAMVRLAEGLDRSHAQVVAGLGVTKRGQSLVIRVRSAGDAELERWAAHRHATALAESLDRNITFELVGRRRPVQKDATKDARYPRHPSHAPGTTHRRRRHRRVRQNHAA